MFENKVTTRQFLMAGIVVAFVLTLFLGNYGIYTHIAHERYLIKEELMESIDKNVEVLNDIVEAANCNVDLYTEWLMLQMSNNQSHSIIEDYHMSEMAYDESLARTYNMPTFGDNLGMLMIYDGQMKNMPSDLRIEMNRIFEGYQNQLFLMKTLTPNMKVILNSSYGYTSIMPYDNGIDGNDRARLVDYYEHFNQMSTKELGQWTVEELPGHDGFYLGKTISLDGRVSDRYLLTLLMPINNLSSPLHTFEQDYTFHVIDGEDQLIIEDFKGINQNSGLSRDISRIINEEVFHEDLAYPFMKKIKNDYIVGHPIRGTSWKALAVFDEAAIGKNSLFKTSGFYFLNLLFIGIFSFLVVMVNRHLDEQGKK